MWASGTTKRSPGSVTAMPPIGTHHVDPEGVAALTAWIESMTPERGYPAPAP
jgi:mono/diheme cytochrome c family protein